MTHKEQNLETDEELPDEFLKNLPSALGAHSTLNMPITRTEILEVNGAVIHLLTLRLKGRRFRPQAGDVIRLGYVRALIQALQSYNDILRSCEIEELEKKVEFLERR
jgi:hypothetical protein